MLRFFKILAYIGFTPPEGYVLDRQSGTAQLAESSCQSTNQMAQEVNRPNAISLSCCSHWQSLPPRTPLQPPSEEEVSALI